LEEEGDEGGDAGCSVAQGLEEEEGGGEEEEEEGEEEEEAQAVWVGLLVAAVDLARTRCARSEVHAARGRHGGGGVSRHHVLHMHTKSNLASCLICQPPITPCTSTPTSYLSILTTTRT
jgi:hypothetical protein